MNTQTPFIVGEAGPELFVPDRSGVIVSSSMTGPDKILERDQTVTPYQRGHVEEIQ